MPILHEHTHTHTGYHNGRRRYVILCILIFSLFPREILQLWELLLLLLLLLLLSASCYSITLFLNSLKTKSIHMLQIIEFDTVAREWRMKWSQDDDKASLAAAQKALEKQPATVKAVKGVKSVQRVVCGGCMDFKVIVSLDGDSFGEWEAAGFAPEADFLKEVGAIKGIQQVETQTFTLMPM